jgi:carnitine O-acetyltransferase
LEYVEPLIDHDVNSKMNTIKLTEQLLSKDGPHLQDLLHQLDKEAPRSWIEGFWNSMYIEDRSPVPINISPFLYLKDDPNHQDSISRASSMIFKCANFWKMIYDQKLEPDHERTEPLDMMQYTKLFGTSRIPGIGRDHIHLDRDSNYIILLIKDHFYKIEIFDNHKQPISQERLSIIIKELEEKA